MKRNSSIFTVQKFDPSAYQLKKELVNKFKNPNHPVADRFVWDYWHIPNQYTVLRTPADRYFSKKTFEGFKKRLTEWGQKNLGCHAISPIWLSSYVEGCYQEFHADLPHGPWAFVWSLTDWENRKFTGGETKFIRLEILEYWKQPLSGRGIEKDDVIQEVPPLWNQLLVFDPRIPHGVNRVHGVEEPSESRLVLHGWFIEPRPYIEGPVSKSEAQHLIDQISSNILSLIEHFENLQGVLNIRIRVDPSGKISNIRQLPSTLRSTGINPPEKLYPMLKSLLQTYQFKKRTKSSEITLPLIFESRLK